MNLDAQQIDHIVREVVRRLATNGVAGQSCGDGTAAETLDPAQDAKTLSIEGRLFTVACLDGRLDGVKQLQIAGNAVVTPSVIDLLRERGIALHRRDVPRGSSRVDKRPRVGLCVDHGDASQLSSRLSALPVNWCVTNDCRQASAALGSSFERMIVITPRWAELVCQINHQPRQNAISVATVECVKQAASQVDLTALVVNASSTNRDQQVSIIQEFIQLVT